MSFGRLKKWIIRVVMVFILVWFLQGIIFWCMHHCTDTRHVGAEEEDARIAVMSSDKSEFAPLNIARLKVIEPYKYPFWYNKYYTDYFLLFAHSDTLTAITDDQDTLNCDHFAVQLKRVPKFIQFYDKHWKEVVRYKCDTVYTDQLMNKPSFSVFDQIVWFGPTLKDVLDACD